MVVRDRDGTLRAFVNVCRHRGAEVVTGRGSCTTLQCHYHAWTYGLDGKLRAAPRSEADPGFDRRRARPQARAGRQLGTARLRQRRRLRAAARETRSASCQEIVRRGGLDLDALSFHERVSFSLGANWKIAVENYLECYHCAVAHPSFSEVIDVRLDRYLLERHPTFGATTRSRAGLPPTATGTWTASST